MARYNDPFVGNQGYGRGQPENTIDVSKAGTYQFAPDLANMAGNTPYVRRNVIPFLIEAPRFFQFTNNPELAVASLKAFIEVHSRTVNGLNRQLTVDPSEAPVGGAGERIQTATNVTRAVSNPSHGFWELQGRAVTKFVEWWILMGIGDPNTKTPLIIADGNVEATDWDATMYGATVLYVEPDPTMTEVVSAWLCTNMFPLSTPEYEGSKDASQLGQNLESTVEFSALTDVSIGTQMFARDILRSLNLAGMNPNEAPSWFEGISADVESQQNGLARQLEEGASNRLTF